MSFECVQLSKLFNESEEEISALENVSFKVDENEFVCIVGPSGCGKTTILRLIAGLIEPSEGEIIFSTPLRDGQLRSAMIFQEQGLYPWMTALDNIAFGLEARGVGKFERTEVAKAALQKFGLSGFENYFPDKLSGGMRQRVAIGRAFLTDPQILLLDEPFGSLDAQRKLVLQEELLKVWKTDQKTIIFVTHDIDEAILLADRIIVMTGQPGQIKEEIQINIKRPRKLLEMDQAEVLKIKRHIWQLIEEEVHQRI